MNINSINVDGKSYYTLQSKGLGYTRRHSMNNGIVRKRRINQCCRIKFILKTIL